MHASHLRPLLPFAVLLAFLMAGCSYASKPATPQSAEPAVVNETTQATDSVPTISRDATTTQPATSSPKPRVALDSDKGEKLGYVKKVWKADGVTYLTVDYAEMLTGDAAAKAAAERGDESPPPNDYYIVNDNKKLRTFELGREANARYLVGGEPQLHDASGAASFLGMWDAAGPDDAIRVLPYKLTVEGQGVTKLEQVFLP